MLIKKRKKVSIQEGPIRGTMMGKKRKFLGKFFSNLSLTLTLTLVLSSSAYGADRKPLKPSPKDKCPVCGMFVAKYPDWICQIRFTDGTTVFFDGAKDMFKYYFHLKKYNPLKKPSDIEAIFVMEYYSLNPIDGHRAYYVIGSDVYGPMGRELIPLESEKDAREFMKDHKGKTILKFGEITPTLLKEMDR